MKATKHQKLIFKHYYQEQKELYPWKYMLKRVKQRCNGTHGEGNKYYSDKGIKCLITEDEIKNLWFRYKAYLLKRPSIDRIDSNKDYTFENCQIIEHKDNCLKSIIKFTYQFDKQGNFIREWSSRMEAAKILDILHSDISACIKGRQKTAGGFRWRDKL